MTFATSSDRSQCAGRVGPLVVAATSLLPMTDAACREVADAIIRAYREVGPHLLFLQYSPKQSPDSKQRQIFTAPEMQGKSIKRTAILTDSAIVRGAVTALSWILHTPHKTNAFSPKNVMTALDWLHDGAPFDRNEALAMLNAMAEVVKIPQLV